MTLLTEEKLKTLCVEDFLTTALGTSDYKVFKLAGDASPRKYYRVVFQQIPYVLMQWEPFEENSYPFLSVLEHFKKHEVHVPKVLDTSPKEGLILLEDLGDLTLERKFWENQNQELVIPFYKQAINELIKIHYPATQDQTNCTAFQVVFDANKFLWEMNYAKKYLLHEICGIEFSKEHEKILQDTFLNICQTLDQQPKYISHRDFHSRNLMVKLGKTYVIDFQDARMGPIQYDLVSLFRDSYVQLNENIEHSLVDYYLKQRQQYEKPLTDKDHFNYIYELQFIQRGFKACGSFASFYVTRNDKRYLKYLWPTLKRIEASINKIGENRELLKVLNDHGVLERDYRKL